MKLNEKSIYQIFPPICPFPKIFYFLFKQIKIKIKIKLFDKNKLFDEINGERLVMHWS